MVYGVTLNLFSPEPQMHPRLQQDLDQFPQILDRTRQLADEFLAGLKQRPVYPPLEAQQLQLGDDQLADSGNGALATLEDFWLRYAEGLSGSAGPRYLALSPGVRPGCAGGGLAG